MVQAKYFSKTRINFENWLTKPLLFHIKRCGFHNGCKKGRWSDTGAEKDMHALDEKIFENFPKVCGKCL